MSGAQVDLQAQATIYAHQTAQRRDAARTLGRGHLEVLRRRSVNASTARPHMLREAALLVDAFLVHCARSAYRARGTSEPECA